MISVQSRAILDRAGIEVVRAVYAKTLAARVLPKDYADPVEFSGGTVPLGEVDEWLQQYTQAQSTQARSTRLRSNISIGIALVGAILTCTGLWYVISKYNSDNRPRLATANYGAEATDLFQWQVFNGGNEDATDIRFRFAGIDSRMNPATH